MTGESTTTTTGETTPTTAGEPKPKAEYVIAAIVLAAVGVVAGQLLVGAEVTYKQVAGISVFAVLYVLAQGIERVVEVVISAITLADTNFAENRKRRALARLNSTTNGNPTTEDVAGVAIAPAPAVAGTKTAEATDGATETAEAAKETKAARLDIGLFAQGLAFALSYALVSYLEFGIFKTIGVDNMADGLDRLFTALAIMGGSKGLHDLIGKVQKSKEASETS